MAGLSDLAMPLRKETSRRQRGRPVEVDSVMLKSIQAIATRSSCRTTPRNDTAYFRMLNKVRTYWFTYRTEILREDDVDPEDPMPVVPTESQIQGFLLFCLATGRGRLQSKKLTVSTLKRYLILLCGVVQERHGDGKVPPEMRRRLAKVYITKDLVRQGAETQVYEKLTAGPQVILDMIHFLWGLDEFEYHHPRERLQLATLLQLYLYTGLRPGEIIESGCRHGTNKGVLYKDLMFEAFRHNGSRRFMVKIKIRHRKGGDELGTSEITFPLLEDTERRDACPVASLIALAIADGALQGISTAEDLQYVRIKSTRTFQRVKIAPEMAEVPVFRASLGRGQEMSKTRIVDYCRFNNLLKDVAARAGYDARFTTYHIRRGHGAALDRFVSDAVRQKRMGHASASTFQHYLSNISTVDMQSHLLGRSAEQDLMDFTQSIATKLDTARPQPPGSRLTEPRREPGAVSKKSFAQAMHGREDSTDGSDSSTEDDDEKDLCLDSLMPRRPVATPQLHAYLKWDIPRAKLLNLRARAGQVSLQELIQPLIEIARPEHSHWHYDGAGPCGDECPTCGMDVARKEGRSWDNLNRHLLKCFMDKEQEREVAKLNGAMSSGFAHCRWSTCQAPLAKWINEKSFQARVARHVQSHMKDGAPRCLWADCRSEFPTGDELKLHLLRSHAVPLPSTLPACKYCFDCRMHFQNRLEWDSHCKEHILAIRDKFCGQVSRRGVVVWASQCMFCLGDASLTPSERWRSFPTISNLHSHVQNIHLRRLTWPRLCPHPLCDAPIRSSGGFWAHQRDVHGIEPYKPSPSRPVRLEVSSTIYTPSTLARNYLPAIMLGKGPCRIGDVISEVTRSVSGFSDLAAHKARSLVAAALETRGGPDGDVVFTKTGRGQWDARLQKSSSNSICTAGKCLSETLRDALSREGSCGIRSSLPEMDLGEDEGYEVEKVIGSEWTGKGHVRHNVQWSDGTCTDEPYKNLRGTAEKAIAEWHEEHPEADGPPDGWALPADWDPMWED